MEGPEMEIKWAEPPPEDSTQLPQEGATVLEWERDVRSRRPFWDRIRILLLLAVVWGILLWSSLSNDPLLSVHDALINQFSAKWWLEVLFGLELLRQISYLTAEHWSRWHRLSSRVVGGLESRHMRLSDWTRYRIARTTRWVVVILLVAVIAGAILHESPIRALFDLPSKLYSNAPVLFQYLLLLVFAVGQFAAIFWFLSRGGMDVYFPDDVKTRFSDVWGQDSVLDRIRESMVFLEDPASIEDRGGYVPGGILLWGPPGTGKTLMAESMAGETGKPFVFVDPGAFNAMFVGVGILKVKSLFRKLRRLAVRYGGVLVFFDEADSLGSRGALSPGGIFGGGAGMAGASPFGASSPWGAGCHGSSYLSSDTVSLLLGSHLAASRAPEPEPRLRNRAMAMGMNGGGMGTLQALLTELSGLKKPRGFMNRVVRRLLGLPAKNPPKYRIMVVMATNMPQSLDEALLRPGRIDRIYKVGYPSKAGRVRTYEGYFAKVSNMLTPDDIEKLATITPYATGATMKDLVNESLIMAIRDGREYVTWNDVLRAKQLKELGPPEDVEYIERERHAVAVHEACHAVVAYRVRHHLEIDLATIEKGGTYLGMVASIKPEDQFTSWRSEFEADVMVSLASLAGERQFFGGDSSSGVSGDLESATTIASMMEGYWGMGSTIASHGVTQRIGIGGGNGRGEGKGEPKGKDLLAGSLGGRIETKLHELLNRTDQLLAENRREVLAVAHALEQHKTLSGEDVIAVIECRLGPVVDGRPYASDAFVAMAEEYHRQVVTAHQLHGRLDTPLFRPADWAPELVLVGEHVNGSEPALVGEHSYVSEQLGAGPPLAGPDASAPGTDGTGFNGAGHNGSAPGHSNGNGQDA
jgi:ATP-dependent Zn protease